MTTPRTVTTTRIVLPHVDAQSAVLSDDGNREGFHAGTVVWRSDTTARPELSREPAVRGDVLIPSRMTVTFTLRRNTDSQLPATHTIEITFDMPATAPHTVVANVTGVLMNAAQRTHGEPLTGRLITAAPNHFVFGLSAFPSDAERNGALLRDRRRFDIPIVYQDGHRAMLAINKGTAGERILNDAIAVWQKAGAADANGTNAGAAK